MKRPRGGEIDPGGTCQRLASRVSDALESASEQAALRLRDGEDHAALERGPPGRYHLHYASGGASGYGRCDFGTRCHVESRRDTVKSNAGRPRQPVSQDLDGGPDSARGRQCFHEWAETHGQAEDGTVTVTAG